MRFDALTLCATWSDCGLQLNESFKSGNSGVYLIPYEEFYVPELRDRVDLRKDFVTWLRVSGSTVLALSLLCCRWRSLVVMTVQISTSTS